MNLFQLQDWARATLCPKYTNDGPVKWVAANVHRYTRMLQHRKSSGAQAVTCVGFWYAVGHLAVLLVKGATTLRQHWVGSARVERQLCVNIQLMILVRSIGWERDKGWSWPWIVWSRGWCRGLQWPQSAASKAGSHSTACIMNNWRPHNHAEGVVFYRIPEVGTRAKKKCRGA